MQVRLCGGYEMGKLYKTDRGKVSNAGQTPRYVGLMPCHKADSGVLVFSSISELCVAEYLTWSPDVEKICSETLIRISDTGNEATDIDYWPDFPIVLYGGEVELIEAKYSPESLTARAKLKLARVTTHFNRVGRRFRVIFRTELENDGFLKTIELLRRYSRMSYSAESIRKAEERLRTPTAQYLERWREMARKVGVPIDLLYYLLFHGRLPLAFRPMMHTAIAKWRV
jgi:hypothetical protein